MFGTFSHAPELIIVLIIALVIFGPKKLPDLGKGLGQGIREFRRANNPDPDKVDAETAGKDAITAASAATPVVAEGPKSSADTTTGATLAHEPPAATTHAADHKPAV